MASTGQTQGDTGARRVVVGLSGGVDSAVAAALLQERGYDVYGLTLDTWRAAGSGEGHLAAAQAVADALDIPLIRRDVRQAFYSRVIQPFVDAYCSGRTPNPCVLCNPTLKLATLLAEADVVGAEWIATGHYARVVRTSGIGSLLRAKAGAKDQSYALYRLTQLQLSRLLLPLGDVGSKDEVRDTARRLGLPASETEDSQDLCFVAEGGYASLLASLDPKALRPGPIVDEAGNQIGEHHGLARYTVGQRSGLGIAAQERLYVVGLDAAHNALIVGPRASLARDACTLTDVTFITEAPAAGQFCASGRIRYRAPLTPITVTLHDGNKAQVSFRAPQFGVAPGQSLVFYSADQVLGGGIIAGSRSGKTDR